MPNNAISPHRQMADFCSSGENPSPACAFFVRAGARAQAQRQLREGSKLRRSAAARQRALHKERVIYHIHNTCTINSNSNINCLICLICFKVLQGCLRVLGFASPCQKSCAHCPAGARAQAQRQLRRALSGARDRRQPMSISNLIIIFIITLILLLLLLACSSNDNACSFASACWSNEQDDKTSPRTEAALKNPLAARLCGAFVSTK